jgi:hypothetical protein
MNYKLSDLFVGLIFAGLIFGTGFMQTQLKNEPQINMLWFGFLILWSLFAKHPFKTSIPFYILLGSMFYINIFILTTLIVNKFNPDDGWFIVSNGERHRVKQMNWIWGVLFGVIFSPLTTVLYYKKIHRNKVLEVSFTTIFIFVTAIIYINTKFFENR